MGKRFLFFGILFYLIFGTIIDSKGKNYSLRCRVLDQDTQLPITVGGYTAYEKTIHMDRDLDLGTIRLTKYGSEGTGAALQKTIRTTNLSRLLVEWPNMTGLHYNSLFPGFVPIMNQLLDDSK